MMPLQFSCIFGAFALLLMTYTMIFTAIATDATAATHFSEYAQRFVTAEEPRFMLAQSTVDLRPVALSFLEWLAMALGTALTVLTAFSVRFITGKIGLQNSEFEASLNERLDSFIHKAIDYAYTTAVNEVNKPGSGLAEVKVDNWFMSLALSYVNDSAPGIIKKFGLSPQRIEDMIKARLPAYLAGMPIDGGLPAPPIKHELTGVSADA